MRILVAIIAVSVVCANGYAAERPVRVTADDLKNLEQKDADPKAAAEKPNPLHMVADEMVKAQVKLKQGRTDSQAQVSQINAIDMLDQIIEIAQQQQQKQQQQQQQQQEQQQEQPQQSKPKPANTKQSSNQGPQRAQQSKEAGGGGKAATGTEPGGQKGIEWGSLPPKARQEYEQVLKEDFPEAYKRLLEQYYQNLSDQ
ncbi:MAG: hypothetical protein HQ592_14790 [Planctomycetes bacterium]|nr:hypothetical protein [Planctomycetota bacterium]